MMNTSVEPQLEAASAKWLRDCGSDKRLVVESKLLAANLAPSETGSLKAPKVVPAHSGLETFNTKQLLRRCLEGGAHIGGIGIGKVSALDH